LGAAAGERSPAEARVRAGFALANVVDREDKVCCLLLMPPGRAAWLCPAKLGEEMPTMKAASIR
jgi:hypothetical protein